MWVGACGVRGPGHETEQPVEEQGRVAGPCVRFRLVMVGFQGHEAPPAGGRRARGLL